MQAYYRSVLGQEAPALPEERQALRRAMIDYGALQPSPVQKPVDSTKEHDPAVVASSIPKPQQRTDVSFPHSAIPELADSISQNQLAWTSCLNPSPTPLQPPLNRMVTRHRSLGTPLIQYHHWKPMTHST